MEVAVATTHTIQHIVVQKKEEEKPISGSVMHDCATTVYYAILYFPSIFSEF